MPVPNRHLTAIRYYRNSIFRFVAIVWVERGGADDSAFQIIGRAAQRYFVVRVSAPGYLGDYTAGPSGGAAVAGRDAFGTGEDDPDMREMNREGARRVRELLGLKKPSPVGE